VAQPFCEQIPRPFGESHLAAGQLAGVAGLGMCAKKEPAELPAANPAGFVVAAVYDRRSQSDATDHFCVVAGVGAGAGWFGLAWLAEASTIVRALL